jgi:GntR family transcriptional regulator
MPLTLPAPVRAGGAPPPRSLQVEQILRQRLQREYQPGSRFSSEPELCQEFRVSRTLIRGVLARLASEGLVRREARRGTFVAGLRQRAPELSDLIDRLLTYRPNTSVTVLDIKTAFGGQDIRSRLKIDPGEPLVVVRRVMHANGAPLAYLVSFLPSAMGTRLTAAALEREPLASLVPKRLGIAIRRAVQTVEPAVADLEVAHHLEVPIGAPVLLVERDFLGPRDRPIFHSRAFYRGDRYKFSVTLRWDRAGGRSGARGEERS